MEKVDIRPTHWVLVEAVPHNAPEDWGYWATIFEDHGVLGTVVKDQPASIGGYVYPEDHVEALKAALQEAGAEVLTSRVEEEDWAESWKKFFVPRPLGNRFWIRPDWTEAEVPDGRIEIVLNPGQAFGTGDHPTTRMCVELLETLPLEGKSVADIGCGSGILSIVADRLGADPIIAVDNDPASVEVSLENFAQSGSKAKAVLGNGFEALENATYDVVVSNIISATLISVASAAHTHIKPSGWWIVSGIIDANWPDVQAAAKRQGFTLETELQESQWIGAIFRR